MVLTLRGTGPDGDEKKGGLVNVTTEALASGRAEGIVDLGLQGLRKALTRTIEQDFPDRERT